MNRDELFLQTLDDIARRRQQLGNEYELLMAAALLRKLLMDEFSLLEAVNKERRLTIRFEVNDLSMDTPTGVPEPEFSAVLDGISPDHSPPGPRSPIQINKNQFLSRVIARCKGTDLTVRDIIRYFAYVEGAVHVGVITDAKQQALVTFIEESPLYLGGDPAVLRTMRGIIDVVSKGLEPLRQRVLFDRQEAEPHIAFAFLTGAVEEVDNQLQVRGFGDTLAVDSFPLDLGDTPLLIGLHVPPRAVGYQLSIQVELVEVFSGRVVGRRVLPYQVPPNPTPDGRSVLLPVAVTLGGVQVEESGRYMYAIGLGGVPQAQVAFWVIQQSPPSLQLMP